MNRRTLLSSFAVTMVAGCTTMSGPATINTLAADANLIAAGLSTMLPSVGTLSGLSAAAIAKIQGYITEVQAAAAEITASAVGPAPTSVVSRLVQAVNALVKVVTTPPVSSIIPLNILAVIAAASALLPALEAAVGISASTTVKPPMPVDAARLILKSATAG